MGQVQGQQAAVSELCKVSAINVRQVTVREGLKLYPLRLLAAGRAKAHTSAGKQTAVRE